MKFTDAQKLFWEAFDHDRWMLMDKSEKQKAVVKPWIENERDPRHTIFYEMDFNFPKQTRF